MENNKITIAAVGVLVVVNGLFQLMLLKKIDEAFVDVGTDVGCLLKGQLELQLRIVELEEQLEGLPKNE